QRVRDKTEELVSIFDRITDGFIAVDHNWNFTYVNKEAGRIYSKDPNKIIGKNLWEEFPEVINHPFYDAFHKAMNEQKAVQVNDYYASLNKWLEGSIYPSANGITVYFRDVTHTKKSELALKESELRYRTLVETANEGIWQVDENNITTYANDYLASLLGYTKEQMIGRNAFDFISDANKEKVLRNLEERKKGNSSQYELTFVNSKQQTLKTLIQSTPLYKEGKYAGSISMLLDITKRKQAEEQLTANERRFKALIENSSDGIALISAEGTLLYNSPSGEKITGYKNEEIIGTDRFNYIHPDDREKIKDSLKEIFENPDVVSKIELRYLVKDASYKWLEGSYSNLLNDPSVNAIIVNYRDITERKNAEKQLQKNEEQLSLIYNSTILGMWLMNVEDANQFRFETINNAYTNITGKAKEQVIGHLLEEVIPAKNIVQVKAKYMEAVQTGQVVSFFTKALFKIGEITAEIKIIPIKNEEGKVVQLLGTGNNVTEQKKARKELLQMNVQLRELASHLQSIREDERTSIAREIHDELGQQLTVLKMDISWLNKKLMPREENIENKLKGALELIDSTINTVRKIAAELRPSILDDLGLAEAIEWQSREFTNRTGISVNYAYRGKAGKLPPAISIGIFRIFQESLTNVARHANATQVDCLLKNTGSNLSLIMTDNGVGFNLNAKGERKTLGLLGMKERVMMLNGKCHIASEPGKGTTVSVEVPLLPTGSNHE
ncbi:MAG: domain S-box protein, partial [Segetibacter sp.]|nr:domain S-box protein [Segetibacter sp.]